MRKTAGAALAAVLVLLATPQAALGLSRPLSFEEIVTNGHTILVGTVVSVSTRWGEGRKMIWTDYEVAVEEVWKGTAPATTTVSFAGGTVDGESIQVSHVPVLSVGETYVLSLNEPGRLWASPLVGSDQGLLREATESAKGRRVLLDADGFSVGLSPEGRLTRLASSLPSATPGVVTLSRPAPPVARAGEPVETGMSEPVYSDGEGRALPPPPPGPTLAVSAIRGSPPAGEPLTRDALREAVRQVLEKAAGR